MAKYGKRRIQTVVDSEVAEVVAALKSGRAGGTTLLAARAGRRWMPVGAADVNAHLKELSGGDFTAKDFRTWDATVLAAVALAVSTPMASPAARKRAVSRAMKEVAHYLGNTPAVTRSSYVDPRVVDLYHHGATIQPSLDHLGEDARFGHLSTQGAIEAAVLEMLDESGEVARQAA